MKKIPIEISNEDLKAIESFYGKSDKQTIDVAVFDILSRYLNVEHFDPELNIEE